MAQQPVEKVAIRVLGAMPTLAVGMFSRENRTPRESDAFSQTQSVEGLYRQLAGGVEVNVVFPFSPDFYFDLHRLFGGTAVPDATPISAEPYVRENRLLMQEVFLCCLELQHRFLPFVSVDPGPEIAAQIAALEQLEADYPMSRKVYRPHRR